MTEHLINLSISIIGSSITMTIAYIWKFRHLFEKSKFSDQQSAEKEIIKDIKRSKTLRVYAMCGSTFSDKPNSNIAEIALDDVNLEHRYLVSSEENSNIEIRQKELPKNASDLKTKIKNSINEFKALKDMGVVNLDYRLHTNKVGFRLIILDNCLYVSQQENGKFGKDCEMQRIPNDTPAYINYFDYFDDMWNRAK